MFSVALIFKRCLSNVGCLARKKGATSKSTVGCANFQTVVVGQKLLDINDKNVKECQRMSKIAITNYS